jgi:hypothetical protein
MYPLHWPEGWARTKSYQRRNAPYKVTIAAAVSGLHNSLKLLGALPGSVVISSNVPPGNGLGTPRNDGTRVDDPGVSVWWTTRTHGERVIACDRWGSVRENVRACGLALEALRSLERAGASQILERAFTAFGALPASSVAPVARPWWEVLGFTQEMLGALSLGVVDARYRELALKAHPDRGGTQEAIVELNNAREAARRHYGGA